MAQGKHCEFLLVNIDDDCNKNLYTHRNFFPTQNHGRLQQKGCLFRPLLTVRHYRI